jgi:Asparaginase, N-terminal
VTCCVCCAGGPSKAEPALMPGRGEAQRSGDHHRWTQCGLLFSAMISGELTAALPNRYAGHDTIEETAYLLDLLVASDAPVVVTGQCATRRWRDRTAQRTSWRRSGPHAGQTPTR